MNEERSDFLDTAEPTDDPSFSDALRNVGINPAYAAKQMKRIIEEAKTTRGDPDFKLQLDTLKAIVSHWEKNEPEILRVIHEHRLTQPKDILKLIQGVSDNLREKTGIPLILGEAKLLEGNGAAADATDEG